VLLVTSADDHLATRDRQLEQHRQVPGGLPQPNGMSFGKVGKGSIRNETDRTRVHHLDHSLAAIELTEQIHFEPEMADVA